MELLEGQTLKLRIGEKALALDLVLMGVLYLICHELLQTLAGSGASADTIAALDIVSLLLVAIGYPLVCETISAGRSACPAATVASRSSTAALMRGRAARCGTPERSSTGHSSRPAAVSS